MLNTQLWTALITPMLPDGSVDYSSLEKMCRRQEETGIGILLLGSTGEGLNLTEEEKRAVVYFVLSLKPKVPVMAGIGGFNLPAQVDLMHFCDEQGVDAFLLVTPLYAKPGAEGQFEWFSELLGETDTPCMLYNVPSRTGVKMFPEVPARLSAEYEHLAGVKEASGSTDEFEAFRTAAPELPFYSGDDILMAEFGALGASGLVSVASNVWPEAVSLYMKKCLSGNTDGLFPLWKDATTALFKAPNPVPVKVLAQHKRLTDHETVRLPLSLGDISEEQTRELVKADMEIEDWYQNNKDNR